MLLTIFFILGSSVCRGLFNYLILNGILSIWLILGNILSNSLFFLLGCFGKIGYFPFFLVLASLWYVSSYVFLMFDLINKWAYFGSFLVIFHLSIFFNSFSDWFIVLNFLMIIFFIKLILSIKHLILISSLINFLFIILLILVDDSLFCFCFLSFYSIGTLLIIYYFIGCSSSMFRRWINSDNFCPFYWNVIRSTVSTTFPDSFVFRSNVNLLTDVIKLFILLSSILFIVFWLISLSFFPLFLFLNKFFSLNLFNNHSLSLVFNLVIFLAFIFQGFFLRSMSLIVVFINVLFQSHEYSIHSLFRL